MKITGCPIIPSPGYIVVEPYHEEQKYGKTNFVVPPSSEDQLTQLKGKVVAVNKELYVSEYGGDVVMPFKLKSGDIIIHKSYGAQAVTVHDKKYRIVKHPDIIALIKEEK